MLTRVGYRLYGLYPRPVRSARLHGKVIHMGGIFNTRTAVAVVTEALAAGEAVVVEPYRNGHDVTVIGMSSELVTSLAYPRHHKADAEWAENGRQGDVWAKSTADVQCEDVWS